MLGYWCEMRDHAAEELAAITGCDVPETECDVKAVVAHALEHGTYREASAALCEAMEWLCANLKVRKHEWVVKMTSELAAAKTKTA